MIEKIEEAFSRAVKDTFHKMLMFEVSEVKGEVSESMDISAIVDFTGGLKGSVSLSFNMNTASKVVSAFVGEEITNPLEIEDGVGELANMIAGNAKSEFDELEISISIPKISKIESAVGNNILSNLYSCEAGEILVKVALNS